MSCFLNTDVQIRWKSKLAELFGIDPRSLACFRIAIAVILLFDLIGRSADIGAIYADGGMMPIDETLAMFEGRWRWSVHWLSGSVAFQTGLFVVAGLFAVALLVGYHTRLATIGCWILLASLHTRAPLVINGGDSLLRILLFWGMFLPLGRVWSLDAKRRPTAATGQPVFSVATVALLLQVSGLYFCAGMFKWMQSWTGGDGLHYALAWGVYNKPFGIFLLDYPGVMEMLSLSTLALQLVGPLLLFLPWRTAYLRLAIIAAFVAFHTAIELSMYVALFSFVAMAAWTVFLPRQFWATSFCQHIGGWLMALRPGSARGQTAQAVPKAVVGKPIWQRSLKRTADGICLAGLVFMLSSNVMGFLTRYADVKQPKFMLHIGDVSLLRQQWSMFANPPIISYWYVARARLRNGDEVDLLRDGRPVGMNKPRRVALLYPNHRWRKFCVNMTNNRPKYEPFQQALAEYLFRSWNARHGPQQQVIALDLECVYQKVELETDSDGFESTVHARVESDAVKIEDTIAFDLPWAR